MSILDEKIYKIERESKLEVLREAINLHSFILNTSEDELMTVIDVSDIHSMINDIENGVSK